MTAPLDVESPSGIPPPSPLFVPAGYKLTYATLLRMQALTECKNHLERRILMAKFRRDPIPALEPIE